MSSELQLKEIRRSDAQIRARQSGSKFLPMPKPSMIMDKFPSIEVLSRYSRQLLPTYCQHQRHGPLKRDAR